MDQLNFFKDEPTFVMKVTNISRFFNPSSFLTAIKQKSARASGQPLNSLIIYTDVMKKQPEDIDGPPIREGGAYITGLNLEGARWDL